MPLPNAPAAAEFQTTDLKRLEKAIRRIVRANDMQSKAMAKACGLTSAQLVLCKGIAELGEVTTTALSAYADLSPATVVTILETLEERGFIERYRSVADRRIVHTRLTAQGEQAVAAAPEPLGRHFVERLLQMPDKRRGTLIDGVVTLSQMIARE